MLLKQGGRRDQQAEGVTNLSAHADNPIEEQKPRSQAAEQKDGQCQRGDDQRVGSGIE